MKFRHISIAAVLLLGIGLALVRTAVAGGTSPANAIFVTNYDHLTAYPTDGHGDIAPIAVTTDMTGPSAIARDSSGRIYVTNDATNTVTIYAANSNGNVPPIAVIGGSQTKLASPIALALDGSGKIYVLNEGEPQITVYPPLGTGTGIINEAPVAVIGGSRTRLDSPTDIALDARGDIYVANEQGGPPAVVKNNLPGVTTVSYAPGVVTVYPAGSDGNVAPAAIIRGYATGLTAPVAITLDSSGNIYVANMATSLVKKRGNTAFDASINVYAAGSKGDVQPIATISGDNTGLAYPRGLTLDSSGNLYATNIDNNNLGNVDFYRAGSNGNVSPFAAIAGTDTGLYFPEGIVLDLAGRINVLNSGGGPNGSGSVTVYPAGSSGDTAPTATIRSSFNELEGASGIAVDSSGEIYVANEFDGANSNGSLTMYPAGSYGIGPPSATIAGENTGLYLPSQVALDSSGNIAVLNSNSTITLYPAGSTGDVTPAETVYVDCDGTHIPVGIAIGPRGELYVANQGALTCETSGKRAKCSDNGSGNIAVYPLAGDVSPSTGGSGCPNPRAVIRGPETRLSSPSGVAVDKRGYVYVANSGSLTCISSIAGQVCFGESPSVTVYPPGADGDIPPVAMINGVHTGLGPPGGIAVDSDENIYVTADYVSVVVAAHFIIGGAFRASASLERVLPRFFGVVSKSPGVPKAGLFQSIGGPPAVLVFGAGSDGDAAPIATIKGAFTTLGLPSAIAIGTSPHLVFRPQSQSVRPDNNNY